MKIRRIIIGQFIGTALLVSILAAFVVAQNTFRVGDSVAVPDGRTGTVESFKNQEMAKVKFVDGTTQYFMLGDIKKAVDPNAPTFRVGDRVAFKSTNEEGVILELANRGDGAKVKTGPGKYDFQWVAFTNLITPKQASVVRDQQKNEVRQKPIRAQFEDDAQAFEDVIRTVAAGYDPKYQLTVGFAPEAATYAKWTRELTGLSAVCQKYPNLTSRLDADADNIRHNLADWCRIAEQRTAVVKRMQIIVGEQRINSEILRWTNELDQALGNEGGAVDDAIQMLLYDRSAWEKKEMKAADKIYADAGATIPADALKPIEEKIAELKAKIDREAPTRSWVVPGQKDPTSEALATRGFPGAKVLRSGMIFTTWKSANDTSLIGTASNGAKLYRTTIGFYRYKLGNALVKIPGRPYCQDRAFSVGQPKKGGGFGATEFTGFREYGIFVKCP